MTEPKKEVIAFICPEGHRYEPCTFCEKKFEKFVSVDEFDCYDNPKEKMHNTFNGINWAMKNGYTPVYKGEESPVNEPNELKVGTELLLLKDGKPSGFSVWITQYEPKQDYVKFSTGLSCSMAQLKDQIERKELEVVKS